MIPHFYIGIFSAMWNPIYGSPLQKFPNSLFDDFSTNLMDQVDRMFDFIKDVEKEAGFENDQFLQNALRRYETFWLPLKSKHPLKSLIPPLDAHWMWFNHMHDPFAYKSDLEKLMGKMLDHSFLNPTEVVPARKETEDLWNKEYPNEPFKIMPKTMKITVGPDSKIKYNITAVAKRQKMRLPKITNNLCRDQHCLRSYVRYYKKAFIIGQKNGHFEPIGCYSYKIVKLAHHANPQALFKDLANIRKLVSNFHPLFRVKRLTLDHLAPLQQLTSPMNERCADKVRLKRTVLINNRNVNNFSPSKPNKKKSNRNNFANAFPMPKPAKPATSTASVKTIQTTSGVASTVSPTTVPATTVGEPRSTSAVASTVPISSATTPVSVDTGTQPFATTAYSVSVAPVVIQETTTVGHIATKEMKPHTTAPTDIDDDIVEGTTTVSSDSIKVNTEENQSDSDTTEEPEATTHATVPSPSPESETSTAGTEASGTDTSGGSGELGSGMAVESSGAFSGSGSGQNENGEEITESSTQNGSGDNGTASPESSKEEGSSAEGSGSGNNNGGKEDRGSGTSGERSGDGSGDGNGDKEGSGQSGSGDRPEHSEDTNDVNGGGSGSDQSSGSGD